MAKVHFDEIDIVKGIAILLYCGIIVLSSFQFICWTFLGVNMRWRYMARST